MSRMAQLNRDRRARLRIGGWHRRRLIDAASQRGRERYAKDHPELFRGKGAKARRTAFVEEGVWPDVH